MSLKETPVVGQGVERRLSNSSANHELEAAHQSAYLGSALSDNSPFRSRSTGALEMPPLFSPGVKVSQESLRSEGQSGESED